LSSSSRISNRTDSTSIVPASIFDRSSISDIRALPQRKTHKSVGQKCQQEDIWIFSKWDSEFGYWIDLVEWRWLTQERCHLPEQSSHTQAAEGLVLFPLANLSFLHHHVSSDKNYVLHTWSCSLAIHLCDQILQARESDSIMWFCNSFPEVKCRLEKMPNCG
jgi:hypothetical protein